jgi:predicted peptidase
MTPVVQIIERSHLYAAARRAIVTLSVLLLCSLTVYPQASEQRKSFSTVLRRRETLQYIVSLPRQYIESSQRWPVILYLHGAGDRGDNLDLVKRQGPPYQAEHELEFPFIVVSPQLPTTEDVWAPYDRALIRLMEYVLGHYRADRSRIYLTGISMGGMATWLLAKENPGYFAAIVPLAGWTDLAWAPTLSRIPVWVFHGAKDDVVPVSMSEKMVDALRAAGGDPKFTLLTDMNHGIGPTVWNRKDLYDWMLQHGLVREVRKP